ncbi:hypothetical protein [Carp edema virus]|nr:hypothetical protein [Carp edema virus]
MSDWIVSKKKTRSKTVNPNVKKVEGFSGKQEGVNFDKFVYLRNGISQQLEFVVKNYGIIPTHWYVNIDKKLTKFKTDTRNLKLNSVQQDQINLQFQEDLPLLAINYRDLKLNSIDYSLHVTLDKNDFDKLKNFESDKTNGLKFFYTQLTNYPEILKVIKGVWDANENVINNTTNLINISIKNTFNPTEVCMETSDIAIVNFIKLLNFLEPGFRYARVTQCKNSKDYINRLGSLFEGFNAIFESAEGILNVVADEVVIHQNPKKEFAARPKNKDVIKVEEVDEDTSNKNLEKQNIEDTKSLYPDSISDMLEDVTKSIIMDEVPDEIIATEKSDIITNLPEPFEKVTKRKKRSTKNRHMYQ